MRIKTDQTLILDAVRYFVANPSNLTWYPLYSFLESNPDRFEENRLLIIQFMNQFKGEITLEVENIIYITFVLFDLAKGTNIEHDLVQVIHILSVLDPMHSKYNDIFWNVLVLSLRRDPGIVFQLPQPWKAMISDDTRKSPIQIQSYFLGLALTANPYNGDIWLHLAHLFNMTPLVLNDLPQEIIAVFQHQHPNNLNDPLYLGLFCCEHALKNKLHPDMLKIATGLKKQYQNKLLASLKTNTEEQHLSIAHRIVITKPVEILDLTTEEDDDRNNISIIERLKLKLKGGKILSSIFYEGCDLTVKEVKTAINDVGCLLDVLKSATIMERNKLVYALFNDPEHVGANSCIAKTDETYIKKIIKTKNDFEAILAVMSQSKTVNIHDRVKKKYLKTSEHIRSLYGVPQLSTAVKKPKQLLSNSLTIQSVMSDGINQLGSNQVPLNTRQFPQNPSTFGLPTPQVSTPYSPHLVSAYNPIGPVQHMNSGSAYSPGYVSAPNLMKPLQHTTPSAVPFGFFSQRPTCPDPMRAVGHTNPGITQSTFFSQHTSVREVTPPSSVPFDFYSQRPTCFDPMRAVGHTNPGIAQSTFSSQHTSEREVTPPSSVPFDFFSQRPTCFDPMRAVGHTNPGIAQSTFFSQHTSEREVPSPSLRLVPLDAIIVDVMEVDDNVRVEELNYQAMPVMSETQKRTRDLSNNSDSDEPAIKKRRM